MKTKQILITLLLFTSSFLYSQTPKFQWVKGGGSGGSATNSGLMESCKWISTDAKGNIYGMSSIFDIGIQIDTSNVANGFGFDDFAVFSYRCDGSLRWVRYFGGTMNDIPQGMFTDSDGNTFVAGQVVPQLSANTHYGDTVFPAGTTTITYLFVAKLDSNGHTIWLKFPPVSAFPMGGSFLSIQPNNQGNVSSLAFFYGTGTWGSFTIPSKGYYVVNFDKNNGNVIGLTKLDCNGNLGDSYINYSIDNSNNIYLNYTFSDTIFIGGITYPPASFYKYYIAKFSPNGNSLWKHVFGGDFLTPDYMQIRNSNILCVDNNIYLTGITCKNSIFLGDTIKTNYPNQYVQIPIILKLNGINGDLLSTNLVNSTQYNEIRKLTFNNNTKNIVGGGANSNFIIMNNTDTMPQNFVYNNGLYNGIYVFEIDTNLTHFNWGVVTKSSGVSIIEALTTDLAGNIYSCGRVIDSLYNSFGAGIGSQGGPSDFFIAKIAATNNCDCAVAQTFPQFVSLNNNILIVKGTATGVTDSLYWYWGDGSNTKYIAQNTNASHTYSVGGNYSVSLRSYNYCGTKDSTIQITGVGITEQELKYLTAYPNPVSHTLTIENPYQSSMQLSIYSITGKLLYSHLYQNYTTTIDMSPYEAGIYFVEMKLEDGRKAVRKVAKE